MQEVTVIIPVYNTEQYLNQCLDSILNQSLKNIEIICIDDGSTDNSLNILRAYEKKDARLKVLTQKNAGAGAARNKGLAVANGKYLSFLDADDFFEVDMLERAAIRANETQADFVVFKSDQYWDDTKQFKKVEWTLRYADLPPYEPFSYRQITQNIFKVFVGWAWDKLYRISFIKENHLSFQEQRTSNDMLFVFSALFLAQKIATVEKSLAHQRRNNAHSLSNTREKSWQCFYNALTELKNRIIAEGKFDELERDFVNYALHACLWNLNSLSGNVFEMLYHKLKEEWFETLGIRNKSKEYFYITNEYLQYLQISENSIEQYRLR